VVCDDLLEDTSVEELRDSLPEHQPRSHIFFFFMFRFLFVDPGTFFLLGSSRSDFFETKNVFYAYNIESVVDYGTFIILSQASCYKALLAILDHSVYLASFLESVLVYF
jgi:hypothetical protein